MNDLIHSQDTFNRFLNVIEMHEAFGLPIIPMPEELTF